MPVYNGASGLEAALRSVLDQAFVDFEAVVVDDGSTDETPQVLRRFQKSDARIRPLLRPHQGIAAALNAGLQAARGSLIARMDDDDVCAPERFAEQVAWLAEHPDLGLVGSLVEFGGDRELHRGYALYVDWLNSLVEPAEIALNRFVESPFAHPSVVFRRSLVDRFGGYREGDFPEDYELWLRWLDGGVRMGKCRRPLLRWNDPPTRLSRTDARYRPRAFFRCKAEYLARWLRTHNPRHPEVAIWGAGRETRKRIEPLAEFGVRIQAYVEIDPKKIGQVVHGRPVLDGRQALDPEQHFVVACVGSRGAREDIRRRLRQAGFREGRHFVCAA